MFDSREQLALDFHQHYRPWLTDGTANWLWPAAEQASIPLMVLMPGALDHLDRIAQRHPGLKLVLDHVGLNVRGQGPRVFEDLPAVCALAKHPNLAVKASGMPSLLDGTLPLPRRAPAHLHPYRSLRLPSHLLGHRPDTYALHLLRVHYALYRTPAMVTG